MEFWTHKKISVPDNVKRLIRPSVYVLIILVQFSFFGCSNNGKSDAYGQFEATEIAISAEASGKLLQFNADEGALLRQNQKVGIVDTSQLVLQRDELKSQLKSIKARIANINAEVEVQKEELDLAESNLKRTRALKKDGAATEQQLDDVQARVQTARKRIRALQTQKQSIRADIEATQSRIAQVEDKLSDAKIINPVNGRVLTSFVEPHEMVQKGQPLYQIANLDTLDLRVYISGAQLPSVKLGQQVEVLVDKNADENRSMSGHISWIASDAEFTPKMIQTKEERVTQVYAVKVKVPNPNGMIKIGMPGEVNLQAEK
ncbi:HlyD family secretion protein [Fodinibius halophilus]|uniref:HlyD family efflux transporter periplasmic adaptor subunit n=1 Tax=Fodinibius halophilus TaxID=1736908 RepID=A0A6M1SZG6_9BACT|nr:HlyD family efflux transporter periplasmic adaptor subunit [Fodinibius halophilus]NGP89288.1 HlyD family efflux transporter periplasmic adaptor subunit [Fodinibius halophilus]